MSHFGLLFTEWPNPVLRVCQSWLVAMRTAFKGWCRSMTCYEPEAGISKKNGLVSAYFVCECRWHAQRSNRRSPFPSTDTGQEALYLKSLSERQVTVSIKLRDGELVRGWIEYFDDRMLRLTREGKPNLFIYKGQIRTITESAPAGRRSSR